MMMWYWYTPGTTQDCIGTVRGSTWNTNPRWWPFMRVRIYHGGYKVFSMSKMASPHTSRPTSGAISVHYAFSTPLQVCVAFVNSTYLNGLLAGPDCYPLG